MQSKAYTLATKQRYAGCLYFQKTLKDLYIISDQILIQFLI